METLINIWYIFSMIIGLILFISSVLCILLGCMTFFIGVLPTLFKREFDELPFLLGIIGICGIVCITTFTINIYASQNQKLVSSEVPGIISYQGIANVKQGKYNYNNMYFEQGNINDSKIIKLDPNKCRIHHIDGNKIKIVENHIEYLSSFRFLAIVTLDNTTFYDIYLPN